MLRSLGPDLVLNPLFRGGFKTTSGQCGLGDGPELGFNVFTAVAVVAVEQLSQLQTACKANSPHDVAAV